MKTRLQLQQHSVLRDSKVVELWWGKRLLGTVTGGDMPGVRVLSKYAMRVSQADPMVVEVSIELDEIG